MPDELLAPYLALMKGHYQNIQLVHQSGQVVIFVKCTLYYYLTHFEVLIANHIFQDYNCIRNFQMYIQILYPVELYIK